MILQYKTLGLWYCTDCYFFGISESMASNHTCPRSFAPNTAAASSAGTSIPSVNGSGYTHAHNVTAPGSVHDYTHDFGGVPTPMDWQQYLQDRQVIDQTLGLLLGSVAELKKDMGALIERMDELEEGLLDD